jgi:ABC-type enterochelin transport system substrate-binding protein
MLLTPREEIESRIARFQQELAESDLDGAIIVLNGAKRAAFRAHSRRTGVDDP